MKKIVILFLLLAVTMSFASCGIKEKIGKEVGKKLIEKVTDGKVDISGDKFKIKGESGEEVIIGDTKWPDSELAKKIPEFKDGKVNLVMETKEGLSINIEEANKDSVTKYINKIKESFKEKSYSAQSDGNTTYTGSNADGVTVLIVFEEKDKTLSISVTAKKK